MKLVDTLAEQSILEDIIEDTKPIVPPECRGLHYLLFTPYRYGAPYPQGSRFRRAGMTPGVFYGAEFPETAIAEKVFYRYLFFAESPNIPLPTNPSEYTVFETHLRSRAVLDLMSEPFNLASEVWCDLNNYEPCCSLADVARSAGTEVIRYESVRDPKHRANLAILSPTAFAEKHPLRRQSWRINLRKDGALAACEAPIVGLTFSLSDFLVDNRLSTLASSAA